jgi:hypothetical protein
MLGNRCRWGAARAYDSDALAWQTAVVGAGGSVSYAQLGYVDRLVFDLKAAGVWTSLDRLFLFAAESTPQALVDLIARASATAVNSPAFTANRGWQGNGTSSYVDSNFNPVGGGKYSQNDAAWGVWLETNSGSGGMVGNDNGAYSRFLINSSLNRELNINSLTNGGSYNAAQSTGFHHGQRTGASASAAYGVNGAQEATTSTSSFGPPNRTITFLAVNYTALALFSASRLAAGWIGKSITPSQVASFYTAMRTYMTSVGVP